MDTFVSYITPAEFKSAPTALDTASLDQSNIGNPTAQLAVLADLLRRASRWADAICRQPLLAKTRTEVKTIYATRDYRLVIHPSCSPVVSLASLKYKSFPADQWFDTDVVNDIQVFESWFDVYGSRYFNYLNPVNRYIVSYTYTSGFAVTSVGADSLVGATSLTLVNTTGIVVGTSMTVGTNLTVDYVTVESVTGNVVTLAAPTVFAHVVGDPASALPDDIRQAVILLAGFLIRERGSMAVTMNETTLTSSSTYAKSDDVKMAARMLAPYTRMMSS